MTAPAPLINRRLFEFLIAVAECQSVPEKALGRESGYDPLEIQVAIAVGQRHGFLKRHPQTSTLILTAAGLEWARPQLAINSALADMTENHAQIRSISNEKHTAKITPALAAALVTCAELPSPNFVPGRKYSDLKKFTSAHINASFRFTECCATDPENCPILAAAKRALNPHEFAALIAFFGLRTNMEVLEVVLQIPPRSGRMVIFLALENLIRADLF